MTNDSSLLFAFLHDPIIIIQLINISLIIPRSSPNGVRHRKCDQGVRHVAIPCNATDASASDGERPQRPAPVATRRVLPYAHPLMFVVSHTYLSGHLQLMSW